MKSQYVEMLEAFHTKYGHEVNEYPTLPSGETRSLRMELMREELLELFKAMMEEDMVNIADGIADLLYVVFGTAVSYGIPVDTIFGEVHISNMTKADTKNDIGKTQKGPEFKPPKLKDILRSHGWVGE